MNIVSIDPSLVCTAMIVNDKKFVYVAKSTSMTRTGKLQKWFELFSDLLTIRHYDSFDGSKLSFMSSELAKLEHYTSIVDLMVSDVHDTIDHTEPVIIGIEGYSYSSAAGPLIDLVTFGTLLRSRLYDEWADIRIIPPQALKVHAASMADSAIKKGKVTQYRNNDGVSAGSFKKPHMLQCLLDNPAMMGDIWVDRIRGMGDDIKLLKSTPKPVEDMNDAKLMYEWLRTT